MKPETCAIIPARGGSKGIPGKNIYPLLGKPLIAYMIEAALKTQHVGRVFVSTDDIAIASTARQYGAEVITRPAELSGDTASSESALLHALGFLEESEGYKPEITVFLQCTAPLTEAADIDGTIDALLRQEADASFAVTQSHRFLWRINAQGQALGINHDPAVRPMRQGMEPQYVETGSVYVFRTEGFKATKHRFFGNTVCHVVPAENHVDIDDLVDLEAAAVRLAKRHETALLEKLPKQIGCLVLDFDGVLTDNRVLVTETGEEAVFCNRSDGMGIGMLRELGIPVWVLSKERNPVVQARCNKLNIPCYQGIDNKKEKLAELLASHNIPLEETVYVGNDVNDLECLHEVGCPVIVADAHPDLLAKFSFKLSANGGQGAVRELCDLIRKKTNDRQLLFENR